MLLSHHCLEYMIKKENLELDNAALSLSLENLMQLKPQEVSINNGPKNKPFLLLLLPPLKRNHTFFIFTVNTYNLIEIIEGIPRKSRHFFFFFFLGHIFLI